MGVCSMCARGWWNGDCSQQLTARGLPRSMPCAASRYSLFSCSYCNRSRLGDEFRGNGGGGRGEGTVRTRDATLARTSGCAWVVAEQRPQDARRARLELRAPQGVPQQDCRWVLALRAAQHSDSHPGAVSATPCCCCCCFPLLCVWRGPRRSRRLRARHHWQRAVWCVWQPGSPRGAHSTRPAPRPQPSPSRSPSPKHTAVPRLETCCSCPAYRRCQRPP